MEDDIVREAEYKMPVLCPGCVTRYGGPGVPEKDCPQCGGTGIVEFGVVETVRRDDRR